MARHAHSGGILALVIFSIVSVGLAGCGSDDDGCHTPTPTAAPTPTPTPDPCPFPEPFCGGEFPLNTLQTTDYGPAWADVSTSPGDFVPCFGPYALCYYAECTVSPDGSVSDCPCYEWFGTSYVLTNAILNLDVYNATKSQCDADPASCQQVNGAPVCAAINDGTFYPGGAQRVSTFSFYRAMQEPIGRQDCTDDPGLYAGCMTAPCEGGTPDPETGTVSISCECPNYDGPFQIGKSGLSCDVLPQVWSAAFSPGGTPPDPCDIVNGCVPDAPPDECGCPLYTTGTVLPPGSGVDCNVVCEEYDSCRRNDTIELGYTCDATLCTTQEHDLLIDACNGLQNCDLSEVFKAEKAAGCSCCASQLCGCTANQATSERVYELNAAQRDEGETPQCDINGTLCGVAP